MNYEQQSSWDGIEQPVRSTSDGLDLRSVRNANKFRIDIYKKGVDYDTIFEGYTSTHYKRNSIVKFGSYTDNVLSIMNRTQGSVAGAMWNGISGKLGWGGTSCRYDAPLNPYMSETGRYDFTVDAFLPFLYDPGDGSVRLSFERNVLSPIQSLYELSLPRKNGSITNDAVKRLESMIDGFGDWLEKGHEDNVFFAGAAGGVRGLKQFTNGLIELDNPLQLQEGVVINAFIGPTMYPNVLVTGVDVTMAKMMYTDRYGEVYPTHAQVSVSFTSKYRDRMDTLWYGVAENMKLKKYRI